MMSKTHLLSFLGVYYLVCLDSIITTAKENKKGQQSTGRSICPGTQETGPNKAIMIELKTKVLWDRKGGGCSWHRKA